MVIRNSKSGRAEAQDAFVQAALDRLGPTARLVTFEPGTDPAGKARQAAEEGADIVIAAGGDGTIMGVANGLVGTDAAMGVLPAGTFNFYARGLGFPEDVEAAADANLNGSVACLSLGAVGDQIFLNNASIGVYPTILKNREEVYRSWGRSRLAAYWSVIKTFLRVQRPIRMTLTVDGVERRMVTPLLFVGRSVYQMEMFGLPGREAVERDELVAFVGTRGGRRGLFLQAWHLMRGTMREGRDFDVLTGREMIVRTRRKRVLVACDGEKFRMDSPIRFAMRDRCLNVIIPRTKDEEAA